MTSEEILSELFEFLSMEREAVQEMLLAHGIPDTLRQNLFGQRTILDELWVWHSSMAERLREEARGTH